MANRSPEFGGHLSGTVTTGGATLKFTSLATTKHIGGYMVNAPSGSIAVAVNNATNFVTVPEGQSMSLDLQGLTYLTVKGVNASAKYELLWWSAL